MQNLLNDLKTLLEQDERLVLDGKLVKNKIIELALTFDKDLLKTLLSNEPIRTHFFTAVESPFDNDTHKSPFDNGTYKSHFEGGTGDVLVFDKIKFVRFVSNKNFLPNSYTSYKNKIGLIREGDYNDDFITKRNDVVLAFPYKDCILQGGQTKEDDKRNEVFWNETLAPDQIDRLLEPKCFTNWKLYNKDGVKDLTGFQNLSGLNLENQNYIIKGNNLLVLHSLKKQFAGKVKLIYIDPPYNTGNDGFNYNDSFNHSSWLTFMKNRLTVAKDLLKSDGVIFVSIDDNEQAYIKLLMDEIFGRENFVANIVAQTNPRGRTLDKYLAKTFEYLIVYTKNTTQTSLYEIPKSGKALLEYNKEDANGRYRLLELRNRNPMFHRGNRPKMYFPIYVNPKNGSVSLTQDITFSEEALPLNSKEEEGCWTWGLEKTAKEINLLVGKKVSTGSWRIYRKDYIPDGGATTMEKTLWLDNSINHENGKEELGRIFGKTPFSFPKSVELIKKCLRIGTKNNTNDIILDFFAGSGTTAQAVIELNREDYGNRQYILCEQLDYALSIPVERINRVKNENESFVYCELLKWNQIFMDRINAVETPGKETQNNMNIAAEPQAKYNDKATMELIKIFNDMVKYGFIDYLIDKKLFDEHIEDFKAMDINEQKKFLIHILDKNQLYLSYSEIEDETHKVSPLDKKLNEKFYNLK